MKNKLSQPRQEGPPASSGGAAGMKGNPSSTATHTPSLYVGRPCTKGHDGLRFKRNYECVLCRRAKYKRYIGKHGKTRNAKRRALLIAKRQAEGLTVRPRSLTPEQRREAERIYRRNRDARKRGGSGRLTFGIRKKLFFLQHGKCAICQARLKTTGLQKFHLDHIEPLALGGPHCDRNVQLLCPSCNVRKGAMPPLQFMQHVGRLL